MNEEELRAQAKAAIAAGADPAEVQKVLANSLAQLAVKQATGADSADELPEGGQIRNAVGSTLASVVSGIPGGKTAVAGLRSLPLVGNGQSFRENANDVDKAAGQVPSALGVPMQAAGAMMGGSVLGKLLSAGASAAKIGGAYGGASAALDSRDESIPERLVRTGVGAAGGAAAAKGTDLAMKGGAALLNKGGAAIRAYKSPTPSAEILRQEGERGADAAANYADALQHGQGATDTPELAAFLQHPEIRPIAKRLSQLEAFRGIQGPKPPEYFDALYKALSDEASALKSGVQSATTRSTNIKGAELGNIRALQGQLLDALDPVMPGYRKAVMDYADQSAEIAATRNGSNAVKAALKSTTPAEKAAQQSPEAFERNAASLPPEREAQFLKGARGEAGQMIRHAGPKGALDLTVYPVARRIWRPASALQRMERAAGVPDRFTAPGGKWGALPASLLAQLLNAQGDGQ